MIEPPEQLAVGVPEALPPYLLRSEIPRIVILRCKEVGYGAGHLNVWRAYRDILLRNGNAAAPIGIRELADEALVNFKSVPKYRDELLAIDLLREVGRQRFSNLKGDDTPEITIPDWIEKENAAATQEWLARRPTKHHIPQADLQWKTRPVPKTVQNGRPVPKTVQNGRPVPKTVQNGRPVPKTVQNNSLPVPKTEQNEGQSVPNWEQDGVSPVPKMVQARSLDRSIVNSPLTEAHAQGDGHETAPISVPTPLLIDQVPRVPRGERALRAGLTVREQWNNARPNCPQAPTELDRIEELAVWLDEAYAAQHDQQGIGPYATIRAIREAIETNPQGFAHAPHAVPLVTHIAERWVADNSWFSPKPRGRQRKAQIPDTPVRAATHQSWENEEGLLDQAVHALLPVVRQVCGFSNADLVPEIETGLIDTATRLSAQRQAEPAHVEQFGRWYAQCYWRGKKDGAKPSLRDLCVLWDQAMSAITAGALSAAPPSSPATPHASTGSAAARRRGPVSATDGVRFEDTIPHRTPRPRPRKEPEDEPRNE